MATDTIVEVVMPQMGVSVSEGTITRWLRQEGEPIQADEPLLEISTDKVDTEVPSPGAGIVAQILVQEGETVEVGTKLAVITPPGSAPPAQPPPPAAEPTGTVSEGSVEPAAPEPAMAGPAVPETAAVPTAPEPSSMPSAAEQTPRGASEPAPAFSPSASAASETIGADEAAANGKTFVSPVVARIASEHGVDPGRVPGTGRGGRVTKKDILAFIEAGPAEPPVAEVSATPQAPPAEPVPAAPATPAPAAPAPEPKPEVPAAPPPAAPAPAPPAPMAPAAPARPPAPVPVAEGEAGPGESFEPITPMRRGVAEHMRRSLDTSAHVTSAIEVDMSRVVSAREQLKKEFQASYGVNPTYLAFVARATVDTLRNWPWINGELRGDKIVTRTYVNLGFAVALEGGKGLIVPVVKNAEGLNLLGLARAIGDVATRARNKQLLPDDVQGGTFTITNPGGFGTFHGTPIISQPQAAILGTYALVKRPWVVQDELGDDVIAIRPIMNLTLTYDHRLVDGAYAGGFLQELRQRLESWDEAAS
jgi:pyruvate/2-oxoglutarate dehydrogenase complex dihydrolipoamide acyltransferase (E2) component